MLMIILIILIILFILIVNLIIILHQIQYFINVNCQLMLLL